MILNQAKKALVGKTLGVGKCQVEHNGDKKCNNWSLGRICKIASRADKYDTRESTVSRRTYTANKSVVSYLDVVCSHSYLADSERGEAEYKTNKSG